MSFRATTWVKSICTTDSNQVESVYVQTRVEQVVRVATRVSLTLSVRPSLLLLWRSFNPRTLLDYLTLIVSSDLGRLAWFFIFSKICFSIISVTIWLNYNQAIALTCFVTQTLPHGLVLQLLPLLLVLFYPQLSHVWLFNLRYAYKIVPTSWTLLYWLFHLQIGWNIFLANAVIYAVSCFIVALLPA